MPTGTGGPPVMRARVSKDSTQSTDLRVMTDLHRGSGSPEPIRRAGRVTHQRGTITGNRESRQRCVRHGPSLIESLAPGRLDFPGNTAGTHPSGPVYFFRFNCLGSFLSVGDMVM